MARCRPAPPGWGSLACWLRCSLLTDRCGYARRSRLASKPKSLQQNRNLFLSGPLVWTTRNRNTENQAPNTKEIPSSKLQTAARAPSLELLWSLVFGVWCLEPGASLELGVWNLELTAWALSFSEIETCPVIIGVRIILRYSAFA